MRKSRLKTIVRAILFGLGALLLVIGLFLFVYPSPINPASWKPKAMPDPTGVYEENRLLHDSELLAEGRLLHPEDIAFDSDGNLYTGTQDGVIRRLSFGNDGKAAHVEAFAETGGFPLGVHFDLQGNLISAVKDVGLVSVNRQGEVTVLTDQVGDSPIMYADELDIAKDGTVYFSDASTKFDYGWPYDTLEGKPYGRLISYNPSTRETKLLSEGFYFANGVVLSPNEDFLLINETSRYRILRYWLKGAKANTTEVFADNLPILPDNISADHEGNYWTAGNKRTALLDSLQRNAFAKQQFAKLPLNFLRGLPSQENNRNGYVIQLSANGEVMRTYQDPRGEKIHSISSVERRGDELFIGTLYGEAIGKYSLQ
ncbi:SMP-30/gluconolactonase/LRE family protein [Paenibacillus apii]|uniref:SMP-30/gluconolactonase/LRE family protein n=1 Tax=Paenibacillus apii TaxID=1850370 RepID=UPI00143C9BF8|nr:SMP-30/gluconolactonase/LRE family protein [Paenibacillus apii]NJJ38096.1 SMP-30/gluconolactonase/LRE family protein [Paenibacillus apii]